MQAFTLAPELAPIVQPALLWLSGATVVTREPRLDAPLAAAESAVRAAPPQEVTAVRTMYKRVGIDPTRTRPSSEALLRRVRKGDTLPRINAMVDVCNWCSLEFQLPYGLYDADLIQGGVTMRLGHEGESYPGIRKDDVHVGGRITLADAIGSFGNPTSDSARTMVTRRRPARCWWSSRRARLAGTAASAGRGCDRSPNGSSSPAQSRSAASRRHDSCSRKRMEE